MDMEIFNGDEIVFDSFEVDEWRREATGIIVKVEEGRRAYFFPYHAITEVRSWKDKDDEPTDT